MPRCIEAVGRFQAQQAAADHHGACDGVADASSMALDIVDVAEGDDALQVVAGERQHDRIGAGGEQQPVVGHVAGPRR